MGFFSWITQDTGRSIPSRYSSRKTFPVQMVLSNGRRYIERNYEGYGVFDGMDYYSALAEMNGCTGDNLRGKGLDLAFSGRKDVKFPNLYEDLSENIQWRNEKPQDCPEQGYFY